MALSGAKPPMSMCPDCRLGNLKKYSVSLEECVILCDNEQCCYHRDEDSEDSTEHLEYFLNDMQPKLSLFDSNTSTPSCMTFPAKNQHVCNLPTISAAFNPRQTDSSLVMLWSNIDALCWLDVLLCILCYHQPLRNVLSSLPYSSVIKKLLLTFDEAQAVLEPLQRGKNDFLRSVMELDAVAVKTGGGFCLTSYRNPLEAAVANVLPSQDITTARRKLQLACVKMECAREEIWQVVEASLGCKRGKDNSPVHALPVILNSQSQIADMFRVEYTWNMDCSVCRSKQVTKNSSLIPTIPAVPLDFKLPTSIICERKCSMCTSSKQTMRMEITRLASTLAIHFAEGLNNADIDSLSFTDSSGRRYFVSSVIEYNVSPNHFILWQRSIHSDSAGKWMVYNDLISKYAQFNVDKASVPPANIHIVIWESISDALNLPTAAEITSHNTQLHHQSSIKPVSPTNNGVVSLMSTALSTDHGITSQTNTALPADQSVDSQTNIALPIGHGVSSSTNTAWPNDHCVSYRTNAALPANQGVTSRTTGQSCANNDFERTLANPNVFPRSGVDRNEEATSHSTIEIFPLTNKDINSGAEALLVRKDIKVPLLSNKDSKSSLSRSFNLSKISSVVPTGTRNSLCYNDAVRYLSKETSTQSTTNPINTNSRNAYAVTKKGEAKTSYLDMVKPLIERTKRKRPGLSGYIPLSKRNDLETTVLNSKLTSKQKRTNVKFVADGPSPNCLRRTGEKKDELPKTEKTASSPTDKAADNHIDNLHVASQNNFIHQESPLNCDMPSLEQLLAGLN